MLPVNNLSRGGKRMLFRSETLANSLSNFFNLNNDDKNVIKKINKYQINDLTCYSECELSNYQDYKIYENEDRTYHDYYVDLKKAICGTGVYEIIPKNKKEITFSEKKYTVNGINNFVKYKNNNVNNILTMNDVLDDEQTLQMNKLFNNFYKVNDIFRLNKFVPSDNEFKIHFDTPFVDKQKNIYSKFTMLIYLTSGRNENGCLSFPSIDADITEINAGDVIIFDQRLEHIGRPFENGEKIFLRSELIYYGLNELLQDKLIAEEFNKACYFQKEVLTNVKTYDEDESLIILEKYSSDLFNHTMMLRTQLNNIWNEKEEVITTNNTVDNIYLIKNLFGVNYITNGNDYYFKTDVVSSTILINDKNEIEKYDMDEEILEDDDDDDETEMLKIMALYVIMDYFNGKIVKNGRKHKSQNINIRSKILKSKIISEDNIMCLLNEFSFEKNDSDIFRQYYEKALIPSTAKIDDTNIIDRSDCFLGRNGESDDCPDGVYSAKIHSEVINYHRTLLSEKTRHFNVVLFDDDMYVSKESLTIDDNVIYCGEKMKKNINFASCQCRAKNINKFIKNKVKTVNGFIVPDIKYELLDNGDGYKLTIDMFENGFTYIEKDIKFITPMIDN